jgi:hypothetical protein
LIKDKLIGVIRKVVKKFTIIAVLLWVVGACLKQPENSVVPHIELQSIVTKGEFASTGNADTLIVTIKFTDGDGDLGVNGGETAIYSSATDSVDLNLTYYYVYDSAKNTFWYPVHYPNLKLAKGYHYVNYASRRKIHNHPFDTLPALSCAAWENYQGTPADTLYAITNQLYFNFFLYLYTKNADGTYTYVDPVTYFSFANGCNKNLFNSRFPVLSSDLGKQSSLDGTITYKYQSKGLYLQFHGKTLKIKVFIYDRAFHKSNLIESDDFTLK